MFGDPMDDVTGANKVTLPTQMTEAEKMREQGPDGKQLTKTQIQKKKDHYRMMFNYPKKLIIENRTEHGKEEVKLQLSFKDQ